MYKDSVTSYFNDPEKWDAVYPYLQGRLSRRFLEHFITEYARAYRCQYYLTDPDTNERYLFNVYHSAQSVLHGVHKVNMDPFNRKNVSAEENGFFEFGHGDKRCKVTVCELLFFRWAIKRDVLKYAEENEDAIKEDMANMARVKREAIGKRKVAEIVIELPDAKALVAADHPLKDEYWRESTAEKKQQPKRQRKRYRESAVNNVFNDDIHITGAF